MAAERLPKGRAVGIDIWSGKDQSGNAATRSGRDQAIDEAWRVLRDGGRLFIADIAKTRQYQRRLESLGGAVWALQIEIRCAFPEPSPMQRVAAPHHL